MRPTKFICLDVGEKRIGLAAADSATRLAYPVGVIAVDGNEVAEIRKLVLSEGASQLVVGYPRNLRGEPTRQTELVMAFVDRLQSVGLPVAMQDESLTSVAAEEYLAKRRKPYTKADIDAHAAAIILTDYLEARYV